MTSIRPSFDEALAFWRDLLRARALPGRLTWVFREDVRATSSSGEAKVMLRPRSAGAGEWLARRTYDAVPADVPLAFAAYATADGHTIIGLQQVGAEANADVRRDD